MVHAGLVIALGSWCDGPLEPQHGEASPGWMLGQSLPVVGEPGCEIDGWWEWKRLEETGGTSDCSKQDVAWEQWGYALPCSWVWVIPYGASASLRGLLLMGSGCSSQLILIQFNGSLSLNRNSRFFPAPDMLITLDIMCFCTSMCRLCFPFPGVPKRENFMLMSEFGFIRIRWLVVSIHGHSLNVRILCIPTKTAENKVELTEAPGRHKYFNYVQQKTSFVHFWCLILLSDLTPGCIESTHLSTFAYHTVILSEFI